MKNNILIIRKKYNFEYLYRTFIVLSLLSVLAYILKLNGFLYADKLFLFSEITLLLIKYINNSKKLKNVAIALLSIFFVITVYILFLDKIVVFFAEKCANSGVKFGIINQIFNTFSIDDFENLIYHTSYGGSKFINGSIVTGAIDIFNSEMKTTESAIFLCGKYLTLFSLLGISFAIDKHKKEVLIIVSFAVLTGNFSVFLLLLLLEFTPYYFICLFFTFIGYFIPNYAKIKSGFFCNGSIFELLIQKDNLVNIFAIGVFITAVSYYVSRLAKEKLKW